MSRFTGWLGGAAARHPWRTIAIWLILIVALFGLKMAFGGQLQDDYTVPGTSSQAGADFQVLGRDRKPRNVGVDHVAARDPAERLLRGNRELGRRIVQAEPVLTANPALSSRTTQRCRLSPSGMSAETVFHRRGDLAPTMTGSGTARRNSRSKLSRQTPGKRC